MAESVQHKVSVMVWTPCSVLAVGFLVLIGLFMIPTCIAFSTADRAATPEAQAVRQPPR